ncbi:MTAP family purine nucleoside phosphorylase [Candidatus Micrarchaeota archaeon]|nr:MTAP family purine nucleoside phosphorylase [Candidatus Micrarchaeota archaeon]
MLGVIGGSGFYTLKGRIRESAVSTPYGNVIVEKAGIDGKEAVFIARHGKDHGLPPHKVNYRANVHAFKALGVDAVLGIYATGVISAYKPGDLILVDDFIGLWTPATFFDDFKGGIKHVDFSQPYEKELQDTLTVIAKEKGITLKEGGIIATTIGPRFESKAEIRALKMMGANLVSMTHAYEATLIGELEVPYVAVAVGTNYACGITKKKLSTEEVIGHMAKATGKLQILVDGLVEELY